MQPDGDQLLAGILAFSRGLRETGSLSAPALIRLAKWLDRRPAARSVETGAGASTLVFSHRSAHHTAFTLPGAGLISLQSSPLLKVETVDFVEGPTQKTLPLFPLDKLQAVLIDGPHAYPFPDLEYFYVYPHIEAGGLLAIDDIHIPTIHNLFQFVRQDRMFSLFEVCDKTAFFERTDAPAFDPWGDAWWLQAANRQTMWRYNWRSSIQRAIPERLRLWLRDRSDRSRLGK